MAILRDRVVTLEGRADDARDKIAALREDVDVLTDFVADEAKLREINDEQIKLLKLADAIHERRLAALTKKPRGQTRTRRKLPG